MHPGGRIEDVFIKRPVLSEAFGELIEPGLVAELVGRPGVGPDVICNGLSVTGLIHETRMPLRLPVSNSFSLSHDEGVGGLGRGQSVSAQRRLALLEGPSSETVSKPLPNCSGWSMTADFLLEISCQ